MELIPPHSDEAEVALLGAIIMDPDILVDVNLEAKHFYRTQHSKLYSAMLDLHDLGEPLDIVTLTERLKSKNQLEQAGGTKYITEIILSAVTSVNYELHGKIIRDLSAKRGVLETCYKVVNMVHNGAELEELASALAVNENVSGKNIEDIKVIAKHTMAQIAERVKNKSEMSGIRTGFLDLDLATDGLQGGDLIILAGRPGMGKSAFAGQIAYMAETHSHVVTVEMKNRQLVVRMLSAMSDVSSSKIRKGFLNDQDMVELRMAADELSQKRITFDDTSFRLNDIRRSILQAYRMGARLVIVDYIQLIKNPASSREREIGEISTMLKNTAKQLDIPIVALAQLNRDVEKRENKRPNLADLRDSGQLEQDADIILFLYREGYYKKTVEDNIAEIIIAKGRNIGTDTIRVGWDGKRTKFMETV